MGGEIIVVVTRNSVQFYGVLFSRILGEVLSMIRKAIKSENISGKKCSFNDAYFLSSIEMGHCRRSSPAFKSLPKIL